MNFFAFLCELVFICVWNYETPLTSPVSQMRFFQPGTTYSQSDVFLVFSQSHDCRPTRGTLPWQEYSIFSAHFELLFGNRKKKRKSVIRTWLLGAEHSQRIGTHTRPQGYASLRFESTVYLLSWTHPILPANKWLNPCQRTFARNCLVWLDIIYYRQGNFIYIAHFIHKADSKCFT